MVTEKSILDAYLFLREKNQSIPSETIEFIYKSSLEALRLIDLEEPEELFSGTLSALNKLSIKGD